MEHSTVLTLWEVAPVAGVLAMWISYLVWQISMLQKRNEKLVDALSSLSTSVTNVTGRISHLNERLANKLITELSSIKSLIIDRTKKNG